MNYYNEFDRHAAAWLRELIKAGLIAEGDVDERSIVDVSPADLAGYTQCHFFAGIGGWSIALRQAGWPDEKPVWTGSCPCQPFSSAGQRKGFADERHLWPEFFRLIRECRPHAVFGEQVASKDGLSWLDSLCVDLEGEDYTVGTVDICAAGFGAPHIRQRLYWVADTCGEPCKRHTGGFFGTEEEGRRKRSEDGDSPIGYCYGSPVDGVADTQRNNGERRIPRRQDEEQENICRQAGCSCSDSWPRPTNGFWGNPDWLLCRDRKWRPVEPGLSPLVNGLPNRTPLLRGYGNAIVIPQAQAFIEAFMEIEEEF